MKKNLLFFALILASYGVVEAQVTTSSLTGVVTETSGQFTPGATIKAIHLPSGTIYSSSANAQGRFNLANMRVGGPYKIEVSYVGQQQLVFEDVYLQLGQPFVLNPTFGETTTALDEVTITGSRRKSDKNGTATVVGRAQIDNLPSISRSVNDLTRLTPQANGTAIGGGNYRANNFTVDGANFNNQFGIGQNIPAGGSPISIDAIEQIVVNVTPFDVRQSGFTGASINAVTRSGRNEFFGSAFYTGRSDKQQGTRVNDVMTNINDLNEKQYGVSLGGPIVKDKLFFFVNLEQNKTTEPGPNKIASSASNPFGSASYVARPSETFLNTVRDHLISKYNYDPGVYQGYSNKSNSDKLFARIDWNIANNHKLNFRYNQVKGKSPATLSSSTTNSNVSFSSANNRTSINALHFSNSNYFNESNLYSATVEYSGSIGLYSHSARFSYVNQNEPRSSESSLFPLVDIKDGAAVITTFGYEPFTFGNLRDVETKTFNYDGEYTLGKHNLLGGFQYETSLTKNGFQRFGTGYYVFDSWSDFVNGEKASNYALTYPMTADGSQAFPSFKFNQFSVYLQDQFSVNSKLKLTAGVRFELPTYPNVSEIQTHPLVNSLTFLNGAKVNTGALPKSQLMFSPRFGFNYDVNGDRSFIVRGGTGVFTGRIPFVWIVAQSGDAGMLQTTEAYSGKANTPNFSPDYKAHYPTTLPEAGTFIPTSGVSAMAENLKFPSTWKSSVAADYNLPWGIQATFEAIYNKDINAVVARNLNYVEPTMMNIGGYADNRFIFPDAPRDRHINRITSSGAVDQNQNRGFNAIEMYNVKGGHYWSTTFQLTKPFSSGISGMIAYTASGAKNYGDGSGDQIANLWSLPNQFGGNSNIAELGYTTNIIPHRIVAAVTYENTWVKHLKTSMTLFYSGGSQGRYSYYYTTDFNRDGQTNDLIYVPRDASEINFVDIAPGTSGYRAEGYTAQEQSDIFFDFVNKDPYLKTRKGQYAERNGAVAPWRNQFDFRLSQELFSGIAKGNNSLEFFWDVFNIGNLFNSSWGIYKNNNNGILIPQNMVSIAPSGSNPGRPALDITGTDKPTFRMGNANGDIIREAQRPNETISSTYYMQFGLKFKFN
ncbi:TonB-dependent receptor [Sphingobacterium composti Ten et al. 2007 non Yoo et al. 2007]|uniref:TonB-dependent receptor n=1 Tax=Sphingobacterium composti TaxID=363260 RepID=UPI0013582620|nr:carboxypeptidase regulatory-like domain-containing protein [Sphingobacterium composti Ten et al. 2007 non Yoo et al. 2007]